MEWIYLHRDADGRITRLTDGYTALIDGQTYAWASLLHMSDYDLRMLEVYRRPQPVAGPGEILRGIRFTEVDGMPMVEADIVRQPLDALIAQTLVAIDRTRDTLLGSGFTYKGDIYQSRPEDWVNLASCGSDAAIALANGSQPGDYRWFHPDHDFGFITLDNRVVRLDAQNMRAMYQTGSQVASLVIMYARALKDQVLAADDYAAFDAIDVTTGWPNPITG